MSRVLIENDLSSTEDEGNTAEWNALITSNLFAPIVTTFYLIFALTLGPKIMEKRRPFSLQYLVMGYNIFQISFNAYLFIEWSKFLWWNRNSFRCIGIVKPGSRNYDWTVNLFWITIINRMLDMLDTVFLILRKKKSHTSFLHIYHHATTFFIGWYFAKHRPGGGLTVFFVWNSIVHFFMYSYYFASAQSYLQPYAVRFKKRLTQLQLIQFITLAPYLVYILTDPQCDSYPKWVLWLGIFQDVVFLYLFGKFYVRAYCKNKKEN